MPKEKNNLISFDGMTKEQAIEEIKKVGFAKIHREDILNYLRTFEKGENRDWLKEAYKEVSKKKLVLIRDEQGNEKRKRVEDKSGGTTMRYYHNIAKTLFFKRLGLDTKSVKDTKEDWETEFYKYWN